MSAHSSAPSCHSTALRSCKVLGPPSPAPSRLQARARENVGSQESRGVSTTTAAQGPFTLRRRDLLSAGLACVHPLFGPPPAASGASVQPKDPPAGKPAEESEFGFDGLGKRMAEYATGKIVALAQAGDGAVLFLGVDGFELPLRMVVGAAEAMAVLAAAQARRSHRPVTHEAWNSSLAAAGWKVDRVMITALERDVFYSRLIISLDAAASSGFGMSLKVDDFPESWRLRSVDMRPSDGIALALRCRAPLFVCKQLVEDVLGPSGARDPAADALTRPGLQADWDSAMYSPQSVSSPEPQGGHTSLAQFTLFDSEEF